MEQRVSVITLGVADLARAKRFYVDGLGWRPGLDVAEIVFFQIGGLVLGLFPLAELTADSGARAHPRA
jgi:catechol 2,3-dioxygenase-like lactoylglutathione lyase family enzyme